MLRVIDTIWVSFVIHKTYFFVFQYNNVLASYLFDKSHITDGDLLNRPAKEVVKATSSYSEPQNKTTVLVNHLQLHGNVKNGLILIRRRPANHYCYSRAIWRSYRFYLRNLHRSFLACRNPG